MNQRRIIVLGVGIFVLLNVSLQIFLIMVGLEAWINHDAGMAWGAAVTSIALAVVSVLLYRYLAGLAPRPRPTVRGARGPARMPDAERATDGHRPTSGVT
jgi:hypothetical protein